MKKIKVNADLYIGEDKLATVKEVNDNVVTGIEDYMTKNPPQSYDDTEIREQIKNISDKIVEDGDGSKFLSDEGVYKEITEYDDTEIREAIEKKANAHRTYINMRDYESFKTGEDWAPAITKAVEDLAPGGVLHFTTGTYKTTEVFPTYKNLTILGDGYDRTYLVYTGTATEGAFIDIRITGFSIKNIQIQGRNEKSGEQVSGQKCSGIWIRERADGEATGGHVINDIMVRFFGEDGIKIHLKVWMLMMSKIRAYHNTNYGINIAGTDNTFSELLCEGNGIRGLSVTGGNNRISDVNCIFNGKDSLDGCEGYFNAWHLSLSNVVCQDAFHNGFIFDRCFESNIDVISDCCGVSVINGYETDYTAYGIKFINKCHNLIGSAQTTNYRQNNGQMYGIYVDSSCYNMNVAYEDVSLSAKGSVIESNMNNQIVNGSDIMYNKFAESGKVLHNIIQTPDFTDWSGFTAVPPASKVTVSNGIATLTVDGSQPYNRFTQLKEQQIQGHVYYHSIKVKTNIEGCNVTLFNNTPLTTPPNVNVNRRMIPNDGEWHTFTWLTQNSGNSLTTFITVGYTGENTAAVVQLTEPMCIDLTEDLGLNFKSSTEEVTSFDSEWMDSIISKYGWFAERKVLSDDQEINLDKELNRLTIKEISPVLTRNNGLSAATINPLNRTQTAVIFPSDNTSYYCYYKAIGTVEKLKGAHIQVSIKNTGTTEMPVLNKLLLSYGRNWAEIIKTASSLDNSSIQVGETKVYDFDIDAITGSDLTKTIHLIVGSESQSTDFSFIVSCNIVSPTDKEYFVKYAETADHAVIADTVTGIDEIKTSVENMKYEKFLKMDCDLKSVKIKIVKGNMVDNKPVVSESGTGKIFDYVMIQGGLVYVFDYVFDAYFYDANKNFISKGTKIESQCILAPDDAVYMVAEYPEGRTVSGEKGWNIGVAKQSDYDEWNIDVRKTILETVNQSTLDYVQVPVNNRKVLSTYFLGDSEASRAYELFRNQIIVVPTLSSFGGHKADFICSNIGVTMNSKDNITSFKNIKALIIGGTNDGDENRLRGYLVETLARLRDAGCQEVWGTGYFCGLNVTQDEYNASKKYAMQKSLYGSHFIDQINVAFGMGLYFNLYHPEEFTQPAVGSNVTIKFEDVTALTECEMIKAGKDFYIQYYDDKYDVYTCVSIDESTNSIVASLKTNNSGIVAGKAAGVYTENVSTGAWTGDKKTIGWVYSEEDKTAVTAGHLPYNIYNDHLVHFGKIFGRIIDTLLFTSGALEIGEKGLTSRNSL